MVIVLPSKKPYRARSPRRIRPFRAAVSCLTIAMSRAVKKRRKLREVGCLRPLDSSLFWLKFLSIGIIRIFACNGQGAILVHAMKLLAEQLLNGLCIGFGRQANNLRGEFLGDVIDLVHQALPKRNDSKHSASSSLGKKPSRSSSSLSSFETLSGSMHTSIESCSQCVGLYGFPYFKKICKA